jgi:hypothetical protein
MKNVKKIVIFGIFCLAQCLTIGAQARISYIINRSDIPVFVYYGQKDKYALTVPAGRFMQLLDYHAPAEPTSVFAIRMTIGERTYLLAGNLGVMRCYLLEGYSMELIKSFEGAFLTSAQHAGWLIEISADEAINMRLLADFEVSTLGAIYAI